MKKLVLAGLVLLASVVVLAGCKNDSVPEVTPAKLVSITVTPPTRTVYSEGDTFDSTGMIVTATYGDGKTRKVTGWTTNFDEVTREKGLKKEVTVSYTEGDNTEMSTFTVDVASYQFTETVQDMDSSYKGTASAPSIPEVKNPIYKKFGDWPQTIKGGDVTVGSGTLVRGGLTYHVGNDGNYYVKVTANPYGNDYKYSDKSDVTEGSEVYFKVEPIIWRVLTEDYKVPGENEEPQKALLLAENILTGGIPYYVDGNERTITGAGTDLDASNTVYPNNYKYSTIRAWLNGKYEDDDTQEKSYTNTGFLQTAFTTEAQGLIKPTTVDNSARSTNPESNGEQWNSGKNVYACKNTSDEIFLLSEQEATMSDYGFADYNVYVGDSKGTTTSTRIRVTTDYAKATGAYQDSEADYGGWWWLRSPSYRNEYNVRYVYKVGHAGNGSGVDSIPLGIVPALSISLQ